MDGLPLDLYDKCRRIFLECDQFQSNERLRAVFVTDKLAYYHNRIPQTQKIEDRVEQCLDFLLTTHQDEKALLLFIEALQARYAEGDSLFADLRNLVEEIRTRIQPPSMDVAPSESYLEHIVNKLDSTLKPELWQKLMAKRERQICHIVIKGWENAYGTGFLLGADVVMTNYHVLQNVIDGSILPSRVSLYL